MGEILRRLTSKCLAISSRPLAKQILAPLQLGIGVKGGCESITHAVSDLISSSPGDQCWTLLLDFSNAFNSVNRESMFIQFRQSMPTLSCWMESCYSCQPMLVLGDHSINSCSGVQQGDPLGPLGFALTLHPIVERISSEGSDLLLNTWYLDDGTLVGSPHALAIVESGGPSIGLHLNRSKSILYIPQNSVLSNSPSLADIPSPNTAFLY